MLADRDVLIYSGPFNPYIITIGLAQNRTGGVGDTNGGSGNPCVRLFFVALAREPRGTDNS